MSSSSVFSNRLRIGNAFIFTIVNLRLAVANRDFFSSHKMLCILHAGLKNLPKPSYTGLPGCYGSRTGGGRCNVSYRQRNGFVIKKLRKTSLYLRLFTISDIFPNCNVLNGSRCDFPLKVRQNLHRGPFPRRNISLQLHSGQSPG